MKGGQFVKLSQLYIIIHGADLCEDADFVNKFSAVLNNNLTKLDRIAFQNQPKELWHHVGAPWLR